MNRIPGALAICVLTLSTTALGASTAAANYPAENSDQGGTLIPSYPPPSAPPTSPAGLGDDAVGNAQQAVIFTLVGAGLALGGSRLYRRRRESPASAHRQT